jgi:hypothetical protein
MKPNILKVMAVTLVTILFTAMAFPGIVPARASAESSIEAVLPEQACVAGHGWQWVNGPSTPALAVLVRQELEQAGIKATVEARNYGEQDSCGNYHSQGIDFTITLKEARSNPSGLREDILPILTQHGKPNLGNVKLISTQGEIIPLNRDDRLSAATPQIMAAEALATDTFTKKVYVIVYDPLLSNGQKLSQYKGWNNHATITQQTLDLFNRASNNRMNFVVVDTTVVTSGWPELVDGFRYTEQEYLAVLADESLHHSPTDVNYNKIVNSPEFDICGKVNRGEIDEVWIYNAPWFGFAESTLVGPGAYMYNSGPVPGPHNCNRLIPIMGPSVERNTTEATHNFIHRTEATMSKVYGGWAEDRTDHNWDRFGLVKLQSPNYSYSGCGSAHWPPNAVSAEYDYSNLSATVSNCSDFLNYPNLSDPLQVSQPLTCSAWGCNGLGYNEYWFHHLPSFSGCGSDNIANDWWLYFADPASALSPSSFCSSDVHWISGNATVAGVTLSYTDGVPKTIMTDSFGDYSLVVSNNWSGTITPSKLGHTFSPVSRSYTNVVANQMGQNYTTQDAPPSALYVNIATGNNINACTTIAAPCRTIQEAINKAANGYTIYVTSGTYVFSTNPSPNVVIINKTLRLSGGWNAGFSGQTGVSTIDGANVNNGILAHSGNIQVENFIVQNSTSSNGGAIYIYEANLKLKRTTLRNNTANGNGAGIFVHDGNLTLINSTIRGNIAGGSGGGIYASLNSGTSVNIQNSTIAYNHASTGGGITQTNATYATYNLTNTIIANNTGSNSGPDCSGTMTSANYNIIENMTGCTISSGSNNLNVDPLLDINLTGVMLVHMPLAGSPAINGGTSSGCPSTDQRGMDRPQGVACDIGAIEVYDGTISDGDTVRVSVDSSGEQGNGSSYISSISADGRYIAFTSYTANLVSGDSNGMEDVFVHDMQTGVTVRVSVDSSGAQANGSSSLPSISADGRFIAFTSSAPNLVPDDINGKYDIFVHDMQTGLTERVSTDSSGAQANGSSSSPSISADGRFIGFQSDSTNLVSPDTNGYTDIFVRDRQTGMTTRISVDSSNVQANGESYKPSISANGRYVAFESQATNLISGDTNGKQDIFVHDLQTGSTLRISVASGGTQANDESRGPSLSGDGRYIVFESGAVNLVTEDTNATFDVFVHDVQTGNTMRVSVASNLVQGNGFSGNSSISVDGRYVAFESSATNLVSNDTNAASDIFVYDIQTGMTTRVSVDSSGAQGILASSCFLCYSFPLSISANGGYIAFTSYAINLVEGDTNSSPDVFVHRQAILPIPPTPTPTYTPTLTPTFTATNTPTYTPTNTPTPTFTPTDTPTHTPSFTPTPVVFTLVLQPDAATGVDSYIYSGSKTSNFGTAAEMGVGEDNNTNNRLARSLMKFDLSSIPTNATITSATLSLWTNADLSSTDRTIRVYRLKVPFNETQVTWSRSTTGINWQTAGASGANDREGSHIGSVTILNNEALNLEKQILLTPSKLQEVVNGTFANNGFIIIAETEQNDRFNYSTSDSTNSTQRPKLVIQYLLASGAPTNTPTFTPTATLTPTMSLTPSLTPTLTVSPTSTFTPTTTATPSQTVTPSTTPTVSVTPSFTPTVSFTPSMTWTSTNTASPTSASSPTDTATLDPTMTLTNTSTASATATPAASVTPSQTATASPTLTFTSTETATQPATHTHTPTPTVTFTPTATGASTSANTPTRTPTATRMPKATPTASATRTPQTTNTATRTPTPTFTATPHIEPLGHWKFDESSWVGDCLTTDIIDSSGNNRNGTACINGDAPFPVPGRFGNAGQFDGINQYANMGPGFNFTSSFTALLWIALDDYNSCGPAGTSQHIIGTHHLETPTGHGRGWGIYWDCNGLAWELTNSTGSAIASYGYIQPSPFPVNGSWHHVALVYDSTVPSATLFWDGVPVYSESGIANVPSFLFNNAEPLTVNGLPYAPGAGAPGKIDDTRAYNRVLSSEEITAIYEGVDSLTDVVHRPVLQQRR